MAVVFNEYSCCKLNGRHGVTGMKGSRAFGTLVLALILAWAGQASAEDNPADGRVPLKIQAADPEGGALSFFWQQKEGPPVKIADPRAARFDKESKKWISETYFVPTEPGNYVFEVTIESEDGQKVSKRFTQQVLPATPLPNADPGKDQKIKVGQKVVLSGQNSKAFNNRTITKYQWTVKKAPEAFKDALSAEQLASRQFDFVPKAPGKYVFELKVSDGKREGEPASVEVVVEKKGEITIDSTDPATEVELPPAPRVGEKPVRPKAMGKVKDDKKIFQIGDTVVLDGSESVVNEAETPRFFWKQIDDEKSPKVRTLTTDTARPFSTKRTDKLNYPVQSFVAAENGIYKFTLQIITGDGVVESDPISFQVGKNPIVKEDPPPPPQTGLPVARLIANKTDVAIGDEVVLDGSKSTSEDGSKLTYIWAPVTGKKFPDNVRGTDGPVARFSAEHEGEYSVMLVVNDGKKQGVSEPVTIRVSAAQKPPVIELEPTQKCNVGDKVAMVAKISDPQNSKITVRWTCLEPKSLKIPTEFSSEPRFSFTPRTPGTYLFQVEATNEKGLSTVAQTQIGVKDVAQLKPTAVITGPERAVVGEKIVLSGATSFSPNKKALAYRWADESEGGPKIKDPVPNAKKQEWSFKIADAGRHVVSLVVNDGENDSEPTKFVVDAAVAAAPPPPAVKSKPVAKITGPKSITAKTQVELSAESSTGTGDGALQYFWTQQLDGGPDLALTANQRLGKILRFTPLKPGQYILNLEVVDQNQQRSEMDTFTLDVKAAPATAPVAVATLLTKDPLAAGKEVRLSADKSNDSGGAPLTYKWKQSKGAPLVIAPRDSAQEIVVMPSKAGAYELQVIVNNGDMDSAPATAAFNVTGGALPQAIIADIAPPTAGDTVILDGSGSKSPNGATGDQLQYQWKQTKGEPLRLPAGEDRKSKIQFTVPAEGEYVWELSVNDGNEWSEPAKNVFQVRPRLKNTPPVAVVERPVISTEVGVETTLDASASNDPDKGPEPLTFRWRKGNNVLKQTGPILKITPPSPGTLTFEVSAFDGKDYSEPFVVTVNVLAAGSLPVAVPTVSPNPAPVAKRGVAVDPQNPKGVIILDGQKSKPADKNLTYSWKQVGGDNLRLQPNALAKDRVGIRVYKPGDYKFELVVSDGENSSLPATVDLKVVEDETPPDKP